MTGGFVIQRLGTGLLFSSGEPAQRETLDSPHDPEPVGYAWFETRITAAADKDDFIRMEVLKLAQRQQALSAGVALQITSRGDPPRNLFVPGRSLNPQVIQEVLAERGTVAGIKDSGFPGFRIVRVFLTLAGVFSLAVLNLVRMAARVRLDPCASLFAVHDENSSRTRHVLAAIEKHGGIRQVVVVGRLRGGFRSVGQRLGMRNQRMIYPCDRRCLLTQLAGSADLVRQASRYIDWVGPRVLAGILFRGMLGKAQQAWWKAHGVSSAHIFFGHTGTADTCLLERSMQARGSRTVHLFHGLSLGSMFTGISSLAVTVCKADATRHTRLGGYSAVRCISAPLTTPNRASGNRLVLFSNLAHPTSQAYLGSGVDEEVDLLEKVARWAVLLKSQPALVWKPHPQIVTLRNAEIERCYVTAQRLGFDRVDTLAEAEGDLMVTSPSTVMLELLMRGFAPLVVLTASTRLLWPDPPPGFVSDDSGFVSAVAQRTDVNQYRAHYARQFEYMGPSDSVANAVVRLLAS